jgi:hypothetical protein
MKVVIKDWAGTYEIPDVTGIEDDGDVAKLTIKRDTLFVASKDIVKVESK